MAMKIIYSMILMVSLNGCGSPNLTPEDATLICRATVATIMGRPISIINANKVEDNIVYVSYNRPSDGTHWKTRCKISGDKVIWSTVDANGPKSGNGRWRDHPADSRITFSFSDTAIVITEKYPDGSESVKSYARLD